MVISVTASLLQGLFRRSGRDLEAFHPGLPGSIGTEDPLASPEAWVCGLPTAC